LRLLLLRPLLLLYHVGAGMPCLWRGHTHAQHPGTVRVIAAVCMPATASPSACVATQGQLCTLCNSCCITGLCCRPVQRVSVCRMVLCTAT
jgi:hypothetical protein